MSDMESRATGTTSKRDLVRARSAKPLVRDSDRCLPEIGCALPQPAFATMEEVCRAHELRLQLRAFFLGRIAAPTVPWSVGVD